MTAIAGRRVAYANRRDHRQPTRRVPVHADLPDWTGAACIGEDPELWFPIGTPVRNPDGETAADICARCDITARCLNWADRHPDLSRDGIWGGLDPEQRADGKQRRMALDNAITGWS